MQNTAIATINLDAVRKNLLVVRSLCPNSRIMAMIKADGYGHGLIPVARALEAADGLAVARLQEALLLRRSGVTQRILLLGTLLDASDLAICSEQHIDVVAHDKSSVACIVSQASTTPLRVWLKLDSGMHRLGLLPDEFAKAHQLLAKHPGVMELVHMTHFSNAEDSVARLAQIACFDRCREIGPGAGLSLANSAALLASAATHADWVRPGIMLYGVNPLEARPSVSLHPAMSLRAYVIAIREIGNGEAVGYDSRWTSARTSRIGTIGIGYGDGYPRHAKNGTPIWARGRLVPLVGRVSMDSLMVDLTEHDAVAVGDEVILWGTEISAVTVAACANTIPYELFTSLQARVTRQYIND